MTDAIVWWLTVEAVGLVAFPIAFIFFRFLPDRGYSFSKAFGLLLLSYLLWLAGSAHIIPYRQWAIILVLASIAAFSLAVLARRRGEFLSFLQARWRYLLLAELLFTTVFTVALFLRSYIYAIDALPSEKYMQNAFINAILRSDSFPPEDPWLSGHSINYYYFGHLVLATLTMLTAIPSRIAFNLSVALIAALTASGAFGLVYNLVTDKVRLRKAVLFGLLGVVFVLILSNLEGLFELLAVHGVGSQGFYSLVDITGLDGPRQSSEWYPTEWYWYGRAIGVVGHGYARLFPFWDQLNGELRPQNLAQPFVLLVMATGLNLWRSNHLMSIRPSWANSLSLGLAALAVGALAVVHVWDAPVFLVLILLFVCVRNYALTRRFNKAFVINAVALAGSLTALAILFYLPYHVQTSFSSFQGVAAVEGRPVISQPHHLLYIWLPLFWLVASLAIACLGNVQRVFRLLPYALIPSALVLAVWAVMILSGDGLDKLRDEIGTRGSNWATALLLMSLLSVILLAFLRQLRLVDRDDERGPPLFALGLGGIAVLVLLGAEFFWIDEGAQPRYNTFLRVDYQAWWLLSISGAFAVYYVTANWRNPDFLARLGRVSWVGMATVLLMAGLIFPVMATFSTTSAFDAPRHLDGLASLKQSNPDEYEAFSWLWDNVSGTPVILEAVGGSQTNFGRVSAYTGLPTVLGWPGHEAHWRGSWEPQAGRKEDVERAYTTIDPKEAEAILAKYDVEYVFVGRVERGQFRPHGLSKFASFMDIVFDSEEATIYRMPKP
jgi:YYY domain-containing protein